MFCFQCEQTCGGKACTAAGVCGKDATTAALQDLLVHATKGIAQYASAAAADGKFDAEINKFVIEALFTTVTNVDFDPAKLEEWLAQAAIIKDKAKALAGDAELSGPAAWTPAAGQEALVKQGEEVSITARQEALGEDAAGLIELIVYGLKGAAAYADHARVLGKEEDEVYKTFFDGLAFLTADTFEVNDLVGWAMKTGELNLKVMELLDAGNTGTYGHQEPTAVRVTPVQGKAILVSGHDLKDLDLLLQQTEGKGINVYTHGEMLPCHAYPGLKKYSHLVGNYGGAWQDQQAEFDAFPGSIVMTTNCIQKPRDSYKDRIFTSGIVAWPGVSHCENGDFSAAIDAALAAPGFDADGEEKTIMVGFGANAVLGVADKVIEAVKGGDIKHFFLIGGCDGARPGRNYYTELAEKVPEDCVILTLACGKYRFNKLDFGDIGGIPRLLDIGQCNDAHSAVQIAVALANAFECGVNDLPLSLVLSWYEQKAVAILLSLLHLGIKNIKVGPSLPAFVTPTVLNVLVENFGLAPTTTADEDLKAILG
ncbi:MAG: hydroxylamine reductase [Planctomycetota bacterium]|jgi:hydroxylamine reductase